MSSSSQPESVKHAASHTVVEERRAAEAVMVIIMIIVMIIQVLELEANSVAKQSLTSISENTLTSRLHEHQYINVHVLQT